MDQSFVHDKMAVMAVINDHKDPLVVGLARTVLELIEAVNRLSASQAATDQAMITNTATINAAEQSVAEPVLQ